VSLSKALYYRYKFYKEFLKNGFNYKGDSYFADEILKEIKSGNYVDIGCYHPIKNSQTFALHKNNWNGVNIDISKETIEMFRIFRKKDTSLNIGIANFAGKTKCYFEKEISMVTGLDKNFLKNLGREVKFEREIQTTTIKKLRKDYNLTKIDFLKIDCENLDEKIITTSSMEDLKSNYLSVEVLPDIKIKDQQETSLDYFKKSNIYNHLKNDYDIIKNKGYSFLLKNRFFLKSSL